MDKESLKIFLQIQSVEVDNRFINSLNDEQRRLHNQVHVLHLAKMFNNAGRTEEAKDLLKTWHQVEVEAGLDISSPTSSSTGELKETMFIWTARVCYPYGGGMACVIANSEVQAHGVLMNSIDEHLIERYVDCEWVCDKDIIIYRDEPLFLNESSYVE